MVSGLPVHIGHKALVNDNLTFQVIFMQPDSLKDSFRYFNFLVVYDIEEIIFSPSEKQLLGEDEHIQLRRISFNPQ